MADDKHPTSLDLGIYSQERVTPRITTVEVMALVLSALGEVRARSARRRDRNRLGQIADDGGRAVLHQPRAGGDARRAGG